MENKNPTVIYLTSEGYKMSSYYGKILNDGVAFDTLAAAENACKQAGIDYIVA